MFCTKCGAANEDHARFCQKCGAELLAPGVAAGMPPPATSAAVEYAGFWKRFAAFVIDAIVVNIGLVAVSVFSGFVGGIFLALFGPWLYFAVMESSEKRATLGKIVLGIVVTDLQGQQISFGRATGRYFAKIISSLILFIGFIMAGFTEKKQALHDMIASCLVVVGK